jgi:hypothetical protein
MPLASVERSVLQYARNQPDLIWGIYGEEGSGRAPEVMQTHGFAKLRHSPRMGDVINAASGEGASLVGGPKSIMVAVTNEPRADRTKIVHEVGDNRSRHPEALYLMSSG